MRQVLHEGGIYRHIILTVPAMFRTTFYHNAAVLLSALMRCGVQGREEFLSEVRGKALQGGDIVVLHTHGRNGQYHPHLHLIATEAIHRLVDGCFRKYPNGLVTNVQKGTVPSQSQSLATYVATYVVSPPIAIRRIDCYDGERVTYHYRSHKTERTERETVNVDTFIGRMVPHTMPKGFKRIRYYGVQATKTFAKVKVVIQEALAKVQGVVKGAVKIIARLTYRQRYVQSTGRDPLICPHCRGEMGVWRIWHPTYGVIHDEVEVIKRGTYASTVQRAGP